MDRGQSVDTIDIITFIGLFAMQISDKSVSIQERFMQLLHSLCDLSDALTIRLGIVQESLEVLERSSCERENSFHGFSNEIFKEMDIKSRHFKDHLNR